MRKAKLRADQSLYSAVIDNLSHEGRGIARIDGKTTFIQGALPGETIEFKYIRRKKDYDEGQLVNVLNASDLRAEPKCQHYQMCGGCSMQHVKEDQQIHFKEEQLIDLLTRFGHTSAQTILAPLTSDHWNYRTKARLSVRYVEKKEAAVVGFRERNNPRYITEIDHCPVLHAKVDQDIKALRQLIDSMQDKHCIAQIEVAAGDDEVALIFRNLSELSESDASLLRHFAGEHGYRVFLQPKGPDSVYSFYPADGDEFLTYNLPRHGIQFAFHPTDFTQVNSGLNQDMIDRAIELLELKSADKVLDLFCGLGNFSLPIAKYCAQVTGVEGSSAMVERAYMNAKRNMLTNVAFFAANLDDEAAVQQLSNHAFNKLLIDPPRSGALEIVKQMDSLNPERIVYVSCNPVTLARDTDVLVNQKGYVLVAAGVMDMFPHTTHVESIALFEKG